MAFVEIAVFQVVRAYGKRKAEWYKVKPGFFKIGAWETGVSHGRNG